MQKIVDGQQLLTGICVADRQPIWIWEIAIYHLMCGISHTEINNNSTAGEVRVEANLPGIHSK